MILISLYFIICLVMDTLYNIFCELKVPIIIEERGNLYVSKLWCLVKIINRTWSISHWGGITWLIWCVVHSIRRFCYSFMGGDFSSLLLGDLQDLNASSSDPVFSIRYLWMHTLFSLYADDVSTAINKLSIVSSCKGFQQTILP